MALLSISHRYVEWHPSRNSPTCAGLRLGALCTRRLDQYRSRVRWTVTCLTSRDWMPKTCYLCRFYCCRQNTFMRKSNRRRFTVHNYWALLHECSRYDKQLEIAPCVNPKVISLFVSTSFTLSLYINTSTLSDSLWIAFRLCCSPSSRTCGITVPATFIRR